MTTYGSPRPVPEDEKVACPVCDTPAIAGERCGTCALPAPVSRSPAIAESDDARAVGELFHEHREPLLRFIRALAYRHGLPDPRRDAEDVLQAVFTAAIEQFPALVNPPAWLYAVARNKLARAAADARRHGVVLDAGELETAGMTAWTSLARSPDPQDVLLARQVVEEIARLESDQQRTVTYLRHVQGWSTGEIAELLQCAPGTVWSHTHRGVTTVRSVVGPWAHPVAQGLGPAGRGGLLRGDAARPGGRELRPQCQLDNSQYGALQGSAGRNWPLWRVFALVAVLVLLEALVVVALGSILILWPIWSLFVLTGLGVVAYQLKRVVHRRRGRGRG